MAKILLVDDDVELTEFLTQLLSLEGFDIEVAHNGQDALEKLNDQFHLILLDVMMPILNGIETLKQIRQRYTTPVLMLTARNDEIDRIIALELGADDYLSKPFNGRELIARIRAILRRTSNIRISLDASPQEKTNKPFKFEEIELYPLRRQAYYQGDSLELTGTEFALLQYFVMHAGKVLTREELSLTVLGKPLLPFDRSIDMHLSNLRKKLPKRKENLPWFKTLRGRGYLLTK